MKKFTITFIIIAISTTLLHTTVLAQFQKGSSMIQARMAHYQVVLDNGNIWVIGGHGKGFKALNTAEIYDLNTKEFTLQNMNYFHDCGALVKMNDGRFLIAGGAQDLGIAPGYNTAEIYDPTNNTFTVTGAMKYNRTNCYGTSLTSGKVLIAGGWFDNNSTKYTEIFDPSTGNFISSPSLVVPRANPMVFPTNDGGAVVFGGYEGFSANPYYQSVEYYNAQADSFSILQNNILPDEEGFYIAAIKSITEAFKTNDNHYVFAAYRLTETDTEYVFLSFDPETKTFGNLYRQHIPNENPFYLIGTVLNKNDNNLYCLWQTSTTPVKLGLGFLSISTKEMTLPNQWFELPESYYPSYTGLSMLGNNSILITGGYSAPGSNTNFSPIDSTLIISLTTTDVTTEKNIPNNIILEQNYPNPFNPTTTIKYIIPEVHSGFSMSKVGLKVYDVLGNEIATLVNEAKKPGVYEVQFNATGLSSGVYFYKLTVNNSIKVKRMILMK